MEQLANEKSIAGKRSLYSFMLLLLLHQWSPCMTIVVTSQLKSTNQVRNTSYYLVLRLKILASCHLTNNFLSCALPCSMSLYVPHYGCVCGICQTTYGHNNIIIGIALSSSYYIYHDQTFITCLYSWWQYSEKFLRIF